MIKMINVNKIHHHPDNPRKNLGNLEELANSIKQSGVLQNLTLVPIEDEDDEYYAVIGNRRLAAAKLAGLTQVPCSIQEMDHKTQVATMLLENMQRSDLTVYEQAQGIQMMLDLGETVADISEKTGFSETTVRRRTKLLELDQDKLKETMATGATLADYAKLEKIKDIDLRNEVLEKVGTPNFSWDLKRALQKEELEEKKKELIKVLSGFATQVDEKTDYMDYETYHSPAYIDKVQIPEDAGKVEYFFIDHGGYIDIYKKREEKSVAEENRERLEREREQAAIKERKARIAEINSRSVALREDFIDTLTNSKVKPFMGDILLLGLETRVSFYMWAERYIEIFNLETDKENFDLKELYIDIKAEPELSMLKIIYYEELQSDSYFNWKDEYTENKELDMLYDLLGKLGYQMSEEERQLQDGTHELFEKWE